MEPEVIYARMEYQGRVWAEVTLNRPEKGNALNLEVLSRLDEAIGRAGADGEVRVVVIRGRGRFFCTGGDIEAWGSLSPRDMEREWIPRGIGVFQNIATLPKPVIAVLSGHALGGGLELALAADLRLALASAKLGTPEATLGMISGWMGVRRLAETIGPARARQMTLLGSPISAAQALDWGLVTAVAEDEAALEAQLVAWLDRLCSNAPAALGLIKDILATMHADLGTLHAASAARAAATEDCREGVRAFLAKRKPQFKNQ